MSDDSSIIIPVIAGLAVGIALIMIFSSFTKPAFTMSDEEIRAKLMTLPEVQAFEDKATYEFYLPFEQIRHEGSYTYAEYSIKKSWYYNDVPDENHPNLTKELRLIVRVDSFGGTQIELQCGGPITVSWTPTIQDIKTSECLEQP